MITHKAIYASIPIGLLVTFSSFSLVKENVLSSRSSPIQEQQISNEQMLDRTRQRREKIRSMPLEFHNKTKGLTVVNQEVDLDRDLVTLTLRNDYKRTITGYKVGVGKVIAMTELLTDGYDKNVLRPGEVRKESYPFQSEIETRGISILAVIFDNGSTDGAIQYVNDILRYRLGKKMQKQHALRLLREVLEAPSSDLSTALRGLESHLSPLSDEEINKLPLQVSFGLKDEQKRLLRQIRALSDVSYDLSLDGTQQTLKHGTKNDLRKELVRLVAEYTNTLSKM